MLVDKIQFATILFHILQDVLLDFDYAKKNNQDNNSNSNMLQNKVSIRY